MLSILFESSVAMIAVAGYSLLTNVAWKLMPIAALGGGLTWFTFLMMNRLFGTTFLAEFCAAVTAAIYAEIAARWCKRPVITFILCSIVVMVPGTGMYYTMAESIMGTPEKTLALALRTLVSAGAIAAGVAFVRSLALAKKRWKKVKLV